MKSASRLRVHVRRGTLSAVSKNDDGKALRVQVDADGIARDDLEVVQEYGLSSLPKGKAEVLFGSVEGQTGHVIVLGFADRRYRVAVDEGEVCLYDDLGQRVHLTRDGVVIETTKPVQIKSDDVRIGNSADSALTRWTELGTWIDTLLTALGTGTVKVGGVDTPVTWTTGIPPKPAAGTSKVTAK